MITWKAFALLPCFQLVCVLNFSCREKKDTEVHNLEEDKDVESEDITNLEQENEGLKEQINELKTRYMVTNASFWI